MAIFHLRMSTFSRGKGESSVAAAAYRSAARFEDTRTGLTHDFHKRSGVAAVHLRMPEGAPLWATDIQRLWNEAERAETRANARVARELVLALPAELGAAQREALAVAVGDVLVDRYRVPVLVAVHEPGDLGDDRNHHAHLLFTTRALHGTGFAQKCRVLDDRKTGPLEVAALRERAAELINGALKQAGRPVHVDHRTLAAQAAEAAARGDIAAVHALARTPTRHEGRAATAVKRRTGTSARHHANAAVRRDNADIAVALAPRARGLGQPRRPVRAPGPLAQRPDPRPNIPGMRLLFRTAAPRPHSPAVDIRLDRAYGRGAWDANRRIAQEEHRLRAERAGQRKTQTDLERSMQEINAIIDAYIRALGKSEEARAALRHQMERQPQALALLAGITTAHRGWAQLRSQEAHQWDAWVRAKAERAEAEGRLSEQGAPPSRLRWKSRRAWEERRRVKQEAVRACAGQVRAAQRAMDDPAAAERVAEAEAQWRSLEARRVQELPLADDAQPDSAPRSEPEPDLAPAAALVAAPPPVPRPRPRPRG